LRNNYFGGQFMNEIISEYIRKYELDPTTLSVLTDNRVDINKAIYHVLYRNVGMGVTKYAETNEINQHNYSKWMRGKKDHAVVAKSVYKLFKSYDEDAYSRYLLAKLPPNPIAPDHDLILDRTLQDVYNRLNSLPGTDTQYVLWTDLHTSTLGDISSVVEYYGVHIFCLGNTSSPHITAIESPFIRSDLNIVQLICEITSAHTILRKEIKFILIDTKMELSEIAYNLALPQFLTKPAPAQRGGDDRLFGGMSNAEVPLVKAPMVARNVYRIEYGDNCLDSIISLLDSKSTSCEVFDYVDRLDPGRINRINNMIVERKGRIPLWYICYTLRGKFERSNGLFSAQLNHPEVLSQLDCIIVTINGNDWLVKRTGR
jgi:hypothetical protein